MNQSPQKLSSPSKQLTRILVIPFLLAIASAQNPPDQKEECYWKDRNKNCRTQIELSRILKEHRKWLESGRAEGTSADLSGAYLIGADLNGAYFEPELLPNARSIALAEGLSTLRFLQPATLVELRDGFKKAGFRRQERKVTFALNRVHRITDAESALTYIFFELICDWGMSPGRCLRILGWLILIFSVPYMFILGSNSEVPGIWKVWSEQRVSKKLGSDDPERLAPRWLFIPFWGLYFSLLSAFHFGWRDLNVGNWIARIQRREYTLRATGWVRVVSGLQSLISVYLLAIWALTYFGRPFG